MGVNTTYFASIEILKEGEDNSSMGDRIDFFS